MRTGCRFSALLSAGIIFISICLLPGGTNAKEFQKTTITVKDGTIYELVSFTVDRFYKIVRIENQGPVIKISFADIVSVVNDTGHNITEDIIGRIAGAETEVWLSKDSDTYRKARKTLWHLGLHFGGNYSLPTTDYYADVDGGFGFDADMLIPVSDFLAIRCTVSKSGLHQQDETLSFPAYAGYGSVTYRDYATTRYMVSLEYYHLRGRMTSGKFIPYLFSGLGLVSHKYVHDQVMYDLDSTTVLWESESTKHQQEFAYTCGGGIIMLINSRMGIDVGGSIDRFIPDNAESPFNYTFIFDVKLGVMLFIW